MCHLQGLKSSLYGPTDLCDSSSIKQNTWTKCFAFVFSSSKNKENDILTYFSLELYFKIMYHSIFFYILIVEMVYQNFLHQRHLVANSSNTPVNSIGQVAPFWFYVPPPQSDQHPNKKQEVQYNSARIKLSIAYISVTLHCVLNS